MTRDALLHRAGELADQLQAIVRVLEGSADQGVVMASLASEIADLATLAQRAIAKDAVGAARYHQRHADTLRPAYNIRTHLDAKLGRHARGTCRCAA